MNLEKREVKKCQNCGHTYIPYLGGTVPVNIVPERKTCPNCGEMYNRNEVWCECSYCDHKITYEDFKNQTGLLPPSGPSTIPPDRPALRCPTCGRYIGMGGMKAIDETPVRWDHRKPAEKKREEIEERRKNTFVYKIKKFLGLEEVE